MPERNHQNKIQVAVSGIESTVRTDTGKTINLKFLSGQLFQIQKKTSSESNMNTSGEVNSKNSTACGPGRKIRQVRRNFLAHIKRETEDSPNRKQAESDTQDGNDDKEDEEMPEITEPLKNKQLFRTLRKICAKTDQSGCITDTR